MYADCNKCIRVSDHLYIEIRALPENDRMRRIVSLHAKRYFDILNRLQDENAYKILCYSPVLQHRRGLKKVLNFAAHSAFK